MRFLILLFVLITATNLSAQTDTLTGAQLFELFHKIEVTDKSYIKKPEIRHQIFVNNFDTIIEIIRLQGFPKYKVVPKKKKNDGNINSIVSVSFHHILQSYPDKFLNDDIISLLKQELESKRMPITVVDPYLKLWKSWNDNLKNEKRIDLTPEQEAKYFEALEVFGIEK